MLPRRQETSGGGTVPARPARRTGQCRRVCDDLVEGEGASRLPGSGKGVARQAGANRVHRRVVAGALSWRQRRADRFPQGGRASKEPGRETELAALGGDRRQLENAASGDLLIAEFRA